MTHVVSMRADTGLSDTGEIGGPVASALETVHRYWNDE